MHFYQQKQSSVRFVFLCLATSSSAAAATVTAAARWFGHGSCVSRTRMGDLCMNALLLVPHPWRCWISKNTFELPFGLCPCILKEFVLLANKPMGPPVDCPCGPPRLEGNTPKLIDLMSKLPKDSSVSETEAATVVGTHGNEGKIGKEWKRA